jgi:hypothetical protein
MSDEVPTVPSEVLRAARGAFLSSALATGHLDRTNLALEGSAKLADAADAQHAALAVLTERVEALEEIERKRGIPWHSIEPGGATARHAFHNSARCVSPISSGTGFDGPRCSMIATVGDRCALHARHNPAPPSPPVTVYNVEPVAAPVVEPPSRPRVSSGGPIVMSDEESLEVARFMVANQDIGTGHAAALAISRVLASRKETK